MLSTLLETPNVVFISAVAARPFLLTELEILNTVDFNTWKLYLFLEHQYQPVASFLLTAAILVYPYLQLKHCLCTLHK